MKKQIVLLAILCTMIITLSSTAAFAERRSGGGSGLEKMQSFLELYDNYLTVSEKWVRMVSAKETTIYLVTEKIVDIYKDTGEKVNAVADLRKLLSKYGDNPTIRNMIHFKIAEIYKDSGQGTKALDELAAIVKADR